MTCVDPDLAEPDLASHVTHMVCCFWPSPLHPRETLCGLARATPGEDTVTVDAEVSCPVCVDFVESAPSCFETGVCQADGLPYSR